MNSNIQLMNDFDYWKQQYWKAMEELNTATNHFDFCERAYVGVAVLDLNRAECRVSKCLEMIKTCQNI